MSSALTLPGPVCVGVDVGGTKILAVALAAGAARAGAEPTVPQVSAEAELPTPRGVDAVVEAIVTVVGRAAGGATVHRVGVGMPGLVTRAGVLRYGANLPGVTDTAIAELLAPKLGVPIEVDNDGNCAAWAEAALGAGRAERDVVFIGLGTGISCGLVVDGQRVRGAHGFAGEPGHATIDLDGPVCACGRRGCWEAFASGTALARQGQEAAAAGEAPGLLARTGGQVGAIRGETVTAAAAAGDPDANGVLVRFAGYVAVGVANVVNVLDPAVVVLGGSVMDAAPLLLPHIRAAYVQVALGGSLALPPRLEAATLGRRAGAIGAALAALG